MLLAHDLGYLKREQRDSLTNKTVEVKRMLAGFIQYLNDSDAAA